MNLIVLAAGLGSRMGDICKDKPKILINLDGSTLLERQLKSIEESGAIQQLVYVVGYQADKVEEQLNKFQGIPVKTIFNPFFDKSSSIFSLYLARQYMDADFAVANGDSLFDSASYSNVLTKRNGIYLGVNQKESYEDDDMKIIFQNDRFARVSKTIDKNEAKAQSMGLVAVSGEKYRQAFRNSLEQMIRNRMVNSFWHDIFNDLAAKTINVETVWINKKWQEFDNCRDIEKFLKFN